MGTRRSWQYTKQYRQTRMKMSRAQKTWDRLERNLDKHKKCWCKSNCDPMGDCFRNASASAVRCTVDGSSSQIFSAYEIFRACGILSRVSRCFLLVPPRCRLEGTKTRSTRRTQTLGKHKREIPPGTNEQAHWQILAAEPYTDSNTFVQL